MLTSTKWLLLFLPGLVFYIAACNSQRVTLITPSPLSTKTATQVPTLRPATPTLTKIPTVLLSTSTPQPSDTPTNTPFPTYTPSPIPPTPTPFLLSNPNPDDLDVIRFIFNRRKSKAGVISDAFVENLELGEYSDFIRQDIDTTGDGQPEILISGTVENLSAYTAILAYSTDGIWQEIFYVEDIGWYCADVQTDVESGRVLVDFLTCWGGTGLLELIWTQHWVECSNKEVCTDIWSAPIFRTTTSGNNTFNRSYTISTIEQSDTKTVQLTTRFFKIADIPLTSGDFPVGTPRRIVGPDIQEIYRWDGNVYQLESKKQIAPGIEIIGEFDEGIFQAFHSVDNLLAQPFESSDGTRDFDKVLAARAEFLGISDLDNQSDTIWDPESNWPDVTIRDEQTGQKIAAYVSAKNRPLCRLTVQRQTSNSFELIGRADVPCTAKFTRLFWVDVTGDDDEELFLLTILPSSEGLQRLYIYDTKETLSELAVYDGAINGSDGIGIKWENSENGFELLVGLPYKKSNDCYRTVSCLTLERPFQTYRWVNESNSFQLIESP